MPQLIKCKAIKSKDAESSSMPSERSTKIKKSDKLTNESNEKMEESRPKKLHHCPNCNYQTKEGNRTILLGKTIFRLR